MSLYDDTNQKITDVINPALLSLFDPNKTLVSSGTETFA